MHNQTTQMLRNLSARLSQNRQTICTAESCTGGLISKSFTDLAGSSAWFECAFVTYSNNAKHQMLGVPADLIETYGAVSEVVANAMAHGALQRSTANYAISVTGVAGPAGGSEKKPVGTVWIGLAAKNRRQAKKYCFDGDRQAVRQASLDAAISDMLEFMDE